MNKGRRNKRTLKTRSIPKGLIAFLIAMMLFASLTGCTDSSSTDAKPPADSADTINPPDGDSPPDPPAEPETPPTIPDDQTPDTSEIPGIPETPETPEIPDTPDTPDTPEIPDTPGTTDPDYSADDFKFFPINPALTLSEKSKMDFVKISDRQYQLEFSPPVTLYAATAPGKPSSVPDGNFHYVPPVPDLQGPAPPVFKETLPKYSKGLRTSFVQKGGDETLWFACVSKNSNIENITWQVADLPFSGNDQDWKTPPGLLKTGQLSGDTVEFSLNFAQMTTGLLKLKFSPARLIFTSLLNDKINPEQTVFYVRAVATDQKGNVIGDPGKGLEILYGDRLTYKPEIFQLFLPFDLLSARRSGEVTTNGEYPNSLEDAAERTYTPSSTSPWYFRPEGFAPKTDTIYIQVCKTPPSHGIDDWRDPTGLVHEIKLEKGEADFDNLQNQYHAIPVDIHAFASVSPAVFYVRAVALSNGPVAGTVSAQYSKTVKLKYGDEPSEFIYYPPPQVEKIEAMLPEVRLIEYQPIRWENPDWMYYYEVVRQPTNREYFANVPESMIPNPNAYVANLVPGTVIKLEPPKADDDSWLEKAWNAVTEFFGSIKDFLADIANWVSTAYADLKVGIIKFAASNLPLIPESLRDDLEKALTYMVDYGLASIGVPPSLPNFDELSSMGVDYLAATALEQAGVPANELTIDTVEKLGGGISDGVSAAAGSGGSPNPLNWNFVRQYPQVLYRPAYILIEISNPYNEPTPPGTLSGKVFRKLENSELSENHKMWMHSAYGGSYYFELYRPVADIPIPRLLAGQTITVPVFLQEYTGAAFPWHPLEVSLNDFLRMYNFFDYFTFSYVINFALPPAKEYAKANNLPDDVLYEYVTTGKGFHFTVDPSDSYTTGL